MQHITVCICTFKRPELLRRLLNELLKQETQGLYSFSVVTVDNDKEESARQVVSDFALHSGVEVVYTVEPQQNIAMARNRAVSHAQGDFIAFIDDDEYPDPYWLARLFHTAQINRCDGVLGPVEPYFEQEPPNWAVQGRFFHRPRHATGYKIGLRDGRTGNLLLRRELMLGSAEPFRKEFGTGGEDVDFFSRMLNAGRVFVWCDEAIVYEIVPASRCSRKYLLRRSLLGGSNSLKKHGSTVQNVLKSLIAAPTYILALPFLLVIGQHHFFRYLMKLCDHLGRLLGLVGLTLVRERDL